MDCPNCHIQVQDNTQFCPSCGTQIPVRAPDAGADPLVGKTLGGKYKIVKLLGEGGMGCVYQGEQLLGTTIRKVAIKTLHPHLSKDAKILARFEREVGTVSELEHPNTIQVFDFGKTDDGILYIVMEFVLGSNLADLLEKNGAMEPARVEKIMTQICGSLEEAHGRGIIHRDLKPENIVLTERAGQKDWVKVLDFGIAKRSSEEDKNEQKLTQQGMVLGTPPYMSPEQFTGKPIDARSDIYSLAIVAYEMLTGKLPFNANTAWEWATQHMTAQPADMDTMPFHERVPPNMKAAIKKALAKAPEDRFVNVKGFLEAFVSTAASPAAMAMTPAPSAGRGKTEMGAPMDFSAGAPQMPMGMGGMGGPSPSGGQYGAPPPSPMMGAQAGTPAQGNVAYPTPGAGVPQAPPRSTDGGGNKGMLLAIAGVVGVLSLGAIVFALKGHSSSGGGLDLNALDAGAGMVDLTPVDAAAAPADTTPPSPSDTVAPLGPTGPTHVTHPTGPTHPKDGGAPEPPKPTPSVTPPVPSVKPQPTPTPPAAEPPECLKARALKAAGAMAAYQVALKACEAKGGHL